MVGLELVDPADGRTPNPTAAAAVLEATKRDGLLIGKGGLYGNCLRIAPPLCVTAEEATEGADILSAALDDVLG